MIRQGTSKRTVTVSNPSPHIKTASSVEFIGIETFEQHSDDPNCNQEPA
ncbi:MAG TPA: hypothetical protein VKR06_09725 [Ktedonosporobacter sp.]|nr:hypothetical protein [Ktedonosporobacter sp.]